MTQPTPDSSAALTTPVVFMVFNRPDLTRRVFAAIRGARPARLLVVADGPRANRPGEEELCRAVRELVTQGVDWPCELSTEFAPRNLGCGPRIYSGLQWAFGQVEEAIILEDDCLPHPTFFRFCTEMLARYRDEPRVAMIAGTHFGEAPPSATGHAFFSRHCSVWGWATWRRALAGYTLDLSWWRTSVQPRDLRSECLDWREHRFICDLLDSQKSGRVNTWDIQWFAHVFRHHCYSVVPGTNLISNLGAVGTHTGSATRRMHDLPTGELLFPVRLSDLIERNTAYEQALVARHRPPEGWLLAYWTGRLRRSAWGGWLRQLRRSWRGQPNGLHP